MSTQEEFWQKELQDNPGSLVFIDYGEALRKEGRHSDALLMCLRGLTANPNADKGRLLLARTYYEIGCTTFAVRELQELLRHCPENEILQRLARKLAPDLDWQGFSEETAETPEQLLAESEFEFSTLDNMEKK